MTVTQKEPAMEVQYLAEAPAINIYKAMTQIMKSVEAIKKEKTNTQGPSFKYRGIDDVMNSLHDAFADAGVFITTEVLDRTEVERASKSGGALFYVTQKIKFTFHAQDGSCVSSTINGTAMDSGDKADNKSLSIGLKYALLQAFLVPTEDMAEPDAQTHEVKAAPAKKEMDGKTWEQLITALNSGERKTKNGGNLIEWVKNTYYLQLDQQITIESYQS